MLWSGPDIANLRQGRMTSSIAARLLNMMRGSIEEPIADIANALISEWLLRWAGHEALIALGAAATLYAILLAAPLLPSEEWAVLPACLVILAFAVHVVWSLRPAMQVVPLWWRLRVGPRQLVRLILFRAIARLLHDAERRMAAGAEGQGRLGRNAFGLAQWLVATPTDRIAWQLAEAVEPRILRHAANAALLALAPILLMFWVFRAVIVYGGLLDRAAHLGPFKAVLYPIATIIDLVAGTSLRALLTGG